MAREGITEDEYNMALEQIRWANSELLCVNNQIRDIQSRGRRLHKICEQLKDEVIRLLVIEASPLKEKEPLLTRLLQIAKNDQERRDSEKKG